ncbi:MAG: alpha/beta fold hydrolase [Malacoplasma sp.]
MQSLQNKTLEKNIIYIHGFGANKNSNTSLIEFCKNNNYKLWSPDLPGHGDMPFDNRKLTIKSFAEFIVNYINDNHIESSIIIGHSMGAAIAACVAVSLKKGAIEKLILISPLNLSIKNSKSKQNLINYFESHNMHVGDKIKKIDTINLLKFALLARNISTNHALIEIDSIYKKLSVPTLVLLGETDPILPCSKSYTYFENLNNKNINIIIQNGDHSLYKTSEICFIKNVKNFIRR